MSADDRYADWPDQPFNATCADCGVDYSRAEMDRTPFCDTCSNRRDQWASAQDVRTMAKAVLAIDPLKIRDIA